MDDSILTSILVATLVAGTPLIITALGELVTEKSGVLNLGAEGIMAVGAVAGFAVAHDSGSTFAGVVAGLAAGAAMSLLFIGGEQAQQYLSLPSSISKVFQGMLLFFLLGSDVFILYRVRFTARFR